MSPFRPIRRVSLASLGTLFVGCSLSRAAFADGHTEVEVAARVGAATSPGWIASPYGLGFGGRVGASFYGFYGGLSATYYLGGAVGQSSFHTLMLGAEAGYTIEVPFVKVRPQIGLGEGSFTEQAADGIHNPLITTTVGNVYVEPGMVVLVPLGRFFVGADANALFLPAFTLAAANPKAVTYVSFSAHAQVGVTF